MSFSNDVDVHARYVQELRNHDDWAALVRYWMAHQYRPALDQAIDVVNGKARLAAASWQMLLAYLEQVRTESFDSTAQPPERLMASLPPEGVATLYLTILCRGFALCELAHEAPIDHQDQLFQMGLGAATAGCRLARALGDSALEATSRGLQGRAYRNLGQLEAALESYDQALAIRRELARQRPEVYWPDVAHTLNGLGSVQRDLNDLEAARRSFDEALAAYRELARQQPDAYRPDVAHTLNGLGSVQRDLKDLEAARRSFDEALAAYRELARQQPDAYRPHVALTLNGLGNVQRDLNDLEAASRSFDEALAGYRELARQQPDVYRPYVVMTLHNLGFVQLDLNHLETARESYDEALAGYRELARQRPDVYRPNVAMTLNALGNVQSDLNDLEAARRSYHEALADFRELARQRPDVYQPHVAGTLYNLGAVQRALNDLKVARASYDEALAGYRELARQRPEAYRADVANTLNGLGNVQRDLNDLEAACRSFDEALAAYRELARQRPDVYRRWLVGALNNLAVVRRDLNDLEAARHSFDEALTAYRELAQQRPDLYRPYVAATLNNLGNVQRDLNDLFAARRSCDEALTVYRELARQRPDVYRPDVSMTLNTLGNVQFALNNLEAAWANYDEALIGYRELARQRPDIYRPGVAQTLNGLGNVQWALNDLEAARGSYDEALAGYRELARQQPEVYWPGVAMSLNGLGNAQRALNNLEAAWHSYDEAIRLYEADAASRPTARLVERQGCWANLGRLYMEEAPEHGWPDWHEARNALRHARACTEAFRGRFLDPQQRQRVQAEALDVYERLVQANVKLWEGDCDIDALIDAVETAEASRARNLVELLADEALRPANAPPDVVEWFRQLRQRLRHAERRWLAEETRDEPDQPQADPDDSEKRQRGIANLGVVVAATGQRPQTAARRAGRVREEWERVQQEYQAAVAAIRRDYDSDFYPDQPVPPVSVSQARTLLQCDMPTAIVQYCLTEERGLALIVTPDDLQAIPLPNLNDRQSWNVAFAWLAAYYQRGQGAWDDALPRLLQPVAERAVQPVVAALEGRGIERLILSPNRALHLFPLHACRLADGRCLTDAYELVYTPSLSILHFCANRLRPDRGRFFLIEDPTEDLTFARVEGACLRRQYPGSACASGRNVSREDILTGARDCRVFHYTGHAVFDLEQPLRSALILGSKSDAGLWLTLRDVFTELRMKDNHLTIISGCESGMIRPDRTDEVIGLPSGFLYAGAQCVLSTLWPVYDLSSALLMDRFHEEWRGGQSVAAALREAQRWLRDEIRSGQDLQTRVLPRFLERLSDTGLKSLCAEAGAHFAARFPNTPPFASPVHWAPFVATGLAYPLRGSG